jgi:hypothetical protein
MTREAIGGLVVCIVVLIGFLWVPAPVSSSLLMGWLSFALSVLPQVEVRPGGVAVFVISFGFAVGCSHFLIRWLVSEINPKRRPDAQIRWRLRSSVSLVLLCMMIFVVGIGMAGVTHQVGWLITSPEPMFVSKTQTIQDSELSTYRPGTVSLIRHQSWLFAVGTHMLYQRPEIDESKPWNSPENADNFRTVVCEAICPSQGNPIWSPDGFGLSHRSGNPDVFGSDSTLRFKDFDSLGDTIFAGDVNAAFAPWADPDALRSLKLGVRDEWTRSRRGEVGYGSAHPSGALMLMGDGAIKFVDNGIDARVLEQLGRRRKEDL